MTARFWRTEKRAVIDRAYRRTLVFVFCSLLTACGKVGDPQPPFIRIPEAVKDLTATQTGYNIVLSWTVPARYVDGSAATNLARVQIRNNGETFTTINAGRPGQAQSYTLPITSAAAGPLVFSIVLETAQRKLSTSNTASITPVDVPGPVVQINGFADQRRIFLEWGKPREHPELADAYIVVRSDLPAEPATVTDTRYEDTRYQPAKMFTYQVTPQRVLNGKTISGIGPESFTVSTEDKKPPLAPTGLDVALSGEAAYLTWEPNSETDLAGYRVFRSDRADGGFKLVADRVISTNSFLDPNYRPGLYYAVTARDESGNESALSASFRGP